jgi:lipid II:glycine glycyltransferase (peptidoglycan interpeptide bridge formation enzyme)
MYTLNQTDWDDFLNKHSQVHLLQTTAWGQVKAAFEWDIVRMGMDYAGAQILFRPLPLGFSWGYIPRGPVGSPDESFWQMIEIECRRRRAVFLKIEPDLTSCDLSSDSPWLPSDRFKKSPHCIQPRRTITVDLVGEEEDILARMKQKTRYNIRLASRKGVIVRKSDDIDGFHQLLQVTGQRETFGIHTKTYYETVYNTFSQKDSCVLLDAEFEGDKLSCAMVFAEGERAWYLYGASSNERRNLMAPYAVQWEAIRWARSKGCRYYDLWGVPDYDEEFLETEFTKRSNGLWGVYRFKRGFGGKLTRTIGAWDFIFYPLLYFFYIQWMKYQSN